MGSMPPLEIDCATGASLPQPGDQRQAVGARVDGHQVLTGLFVNCPTNSSVGLVPT